MSSSSWGSPENIEVEDDTERCDVTPGPSALEAVQIYYGSPTFDHSPAANVDFSVLNYVTNTAEEDAFLYGCSSSLQDEPLKNSQIETKKSPSLEWSDEEESSLPSSLVSSNLHRELNSNSFKSEIKYDSCDDEEESNFKVDLDESNKIHDKPKSSLTEIPQTSNIRNENDKQKAIQRRWDQKTKTKKEHTKYTPFECHSILSAIKKSNESESRNSHNLSGNQKNSSAAKENANINNASSLKSESVNRRYAAPQGIQEQRTEAPSDLRNRENLTAASLISAFLSEAKAKSSGCTSEPSSERTILLKHSKTSSQTEKIVLKTCDKTSKTITNYRPSPQDFSKETFDTFNKYLIDLSKNPNGTLNEHRQEPNGSLPENFEDGVSYKPFKVACKSLSKSANLESSHQRSVSSAVPYKDVGKSRTRSCHSSSRSRNSEYGHRSLDRTPTRRSSEPTPRRRSHDRTPRGRSRDRTPRGRSRDRGRSHDRTQRGRSRDRTPRRRSYDTRYSYSQSRRRDNSRDRSNSYDRSRRRRSLDRNSRERDSKYGSYERHERSRSRHRSPSYSRHRNSRSRSHDRSRRPTYRKSDRSPDRRYRRPEPSEERRRVYRRISPSHSYLKSYRSPSRDSSDSSFSSFETICLEK